jgi:dihydrofolate reductase
MGRLTYQSIGRPLPGRSNIIVSRDPCYRQPGCRVFNSIESALASCAHLAEVFVIGGVSFYQALLPKADTLYLTEVHRAFAGDTFFPEINPAQWLETEREDIDDDSEVAFSYSFVKLERVK